MRGCGKSAAELGFDATPGSESTWAVFFGQHARFNELQTLPVAKGARTLWRLERRSRSRDIRDCSAPVHGERCCCPPA